MAKTSRKHQYLAGMRSGIPVILGFIPVGIAYAIMAQQAGFTVAETVFMSVAVFAGASQMMAVGMYAQGAGLIAMILATFILNLRHLIMSTCVVNRMRGDKLGLKLLAAFGVTDESFAIFTTEDEARCSVFYFLGLITVTYTSWVAGSAIGAVAFGFLPEIVSASLGIALYAMFLGLLMPNVRQSFRLGVLVIITAVANTGLSQLIDSSWALIVSTLACAALGACFVNDGVKEKTSNG